MERVYKYCRRIDFQHTSLTFRTGSYYKKGFLKIEQKQEIHCLLFLLFKIYVSFLSSFFLKYNRTYKEDDK